MFYSQLKPYVLYFLSPQRAKHLLALRALAKLSEICSYPALWAWGVSEKELHCLWMHTGKVTSKPPGGQSVSGETPAQSYDSSSCLMWHLSWWNAKMNGMCADVSTRFRTGNHWCNISHQTLKRVVNSSYLKDWIQRKPLCDSQMCIWFSKSSQTHGRVIFHARIKIYLFSFVSLWSCIFCLVTLFWHDI